MKRRLLLNLSVFVILLSSCSKSSNTNELEKEKESNSCKIVQVNRLLYNEPAEWYYSYDTKGRVSTIKNNYDDHYSSYSYTENKIVETDYNGKAENYNRVYSLDGQNRISHVMTNGGINDGTVVNYSYDNQSYLVYNQSYTKWNNENNRANFYYTNGNLTKYDYNDFIREYEYGSDTLPINFLFGDSEYKVYEHFSVLGNYYGKRPFNLIKNHKSSTINYSYVYTKDAKGNIVKFVYGSDIITLKYICN